MTVDTVVNPFVHDVDHYKRDLNIIGHYMRDQVAHLRLKTGIGREEAIAFVKSKLAPGGEFELKDPNVSYLERDFTTGDRSEGNLTFSQYLGEIIEQEDIVAPTFTTYLAAKVRVSPLATFQEKNVINRGKAKKAMFEAEMTLGEDSYMYKFKKSEQTGKKMSNNSVSGAHVNAHNPLFNKTAHSTLTSICRQTAAYGNANNERFLAGNRHYWCYDVIQNNIISIINNSNLKKVEEVMEKYGLHYPTADEVFKTIQRSKHLYHPNSAGENRILDTLHRMTPVQLAAYQYTGDMYHLRVFNEDFVRGFMRELIQFIDEPDPTPKQTIKSVPEEYLILAQQICVEFMRGNKVKDVEEKMPKEYGQLAATCRNVNRVMAKYADVIRTFWATDNLPASIAVFPDSLRRVVLVSDTDSTIYTVQDWVEWYCGEVCFTLEANAVSAAMTFLVSMTVIHILAKMSANVGVEKRRLFQIAMKNEYKFDVFVLTSIGKHYYAQISTQEGNVYKKPKREVKGVNLKASNVPKEVTLKARDMMDSIMDAIISGQGVSVLSKLTEVANYERSILGSIKGGEFKYLKLSTVKVAEAYKQKELNTNFMNYILWNEVFALKYGAIAAPPYKAITVSVELDTKTKMNEWIASMDETLGKAMRKWLTDNNKATMTTMLLPMDLVQQQGIPDEIMRVINTRKIIQKATAIFYLILETLGVYVDHSDLIHLAMDYY